jgi:myosin heavy subunit
MQALVPMVDLFAVLAIVFMIHSNEEITAAQTEVQEARYAQEAIDDAERTRRERRELMANEATKSLEQIQEERARQAEELLAQFTEMLAAQQSSTDAEYANILARIENDLEQQTQADLEETRAELETDRETQRSELAAQQEQRIEEAEEEFDRIISSTETRLASTQDALVDAEQARVEALARQAALDEQRQVEVARAEQELRAQADRQAANSRRETEAALARAEQARVDELATQAAALDEQRQRELARAEQQLRALADRQAANSRRETDAALARAEQAQADALARAEQDQADALARAQQDQADALARADQERQSDLDAQRTALEEERARALADAADELAPYLQAIEAKNQIVKELNENFGDFDNSAVEIDPETGQVRLHFQESYFAIGSHELSGEMKSFLRAMIPRYAQSIYGNRDAAEQVESLNISGMASPIYQGVYIDIFDTSPETQEAREYNMALSNRRADALYAFIFDEDEMGDYAFRTRMEADMSIAALGFQNATPVGDELVGKPARCIVYDCQQEQATVLQFQLFSGGL